MIAEITLRDYYRVYLDDAKSDKLKFKEQLNNYIGIKNDSKKYLSDNENNILKSITINLTNYKEYNNEIYNNEEELLKRVNNSLKYYSEGKERIYILQIIKYCNVLKKIHDLNIAIKQVENRSKITFKEYRNYVKQFYQYGVHKCCLEGYAYKYGYGIGKLMISRWKLIGSNLPNYKGRKIIDYKATKEAKEKLLKEGKIPYNKEDAEIYKERGIKYNGVKYVVYKDNDIVYDISINDCSYIATRNLEFEHLETINKSIRGLSQQELANTCKTEEDVFKLSCDLNHKLKVYLCFDKTVYLKYIRNASENKYERGAHNCQNRQRF